VITSPDDIEETSAGGFFNYCMSNLHETDIVCCMFGGLGLSGDQSLENVMQAFDNPMVLAVYSDYLTPADSLRYAPSELNLNKPGFIPAFFVRREVIKSMTFDEGLQALSIYEILLLINSKGGVPYHEPSPVFKIKNDDFLVKFGPSTIESDIQRLNRKYNRNT
tara:strand:+ start:210 stop:701 length:492 start_codon:yes stop_codon:yes gene_type:complete